jgi:predicted transcriptional regulator
MGLTDKLDKLLAIKDLSRMGFAKAAGIPYTPLSICMKMVQKILSCPLYVK